MCGRTCLAGQVRLEIIETDLMTSSNLWTHHTFSEDRSLQLNFQNQLEILGICFLLANRSTTNSIDLAEETEVYFKQQADCTLDFFDNDINICLNFFRTTFQRRGL
jgi:hypothetical protein